VPGGADAPAPPVECCRRLPTGRQPPSRHQPPPCRQPRHTTPRRRQPTRSLAPGRGHAPARPGSGCSPSPAGWVLPPPRTTRPTGASRKPIQPQRRAAGQRLAPWPAAFWASAAAGSGDTDHTDGPPNQVPIDGQGRALRDRPPGTPRIPEGVWWVLDDKSQSSTAALSPSRASSLPLLPTARLRWPRAWPRHAPSALHLRHTQGRLIALDATTQHTDPCAHHHAHLPRPPAAPTSMPTPHDLFRRHATGAPTEPLLSVEVAAVAAVGGADGGAGAGARRAWHYARRRHAPRAAGQVLPAGRGWALPDAAPHPAARYSQARYGARREAIAGAVAGSMPRTCAAWAANWVCRPLWARRAWGRSRPT